MKKIVFALVVLLFAAPVWAGVTIDANQIPGTFEVEISYVSDGNLPRAFGLDITVTDGNIIACTPAMEGECTVSVRGFGIFPGTIDIDDAVTPPVVINYGTPVAPAGARGALGGLDTNGITIELGSLYEGPNAPPLSGLICTIEVSSACTVNIAGNAARCGEEGAEAPGDAIGVVMEDPTEPVTITYVPGPVEGEPDCFDSGHADYDLWASIQKPDCWCYKYQCHGDADGMKTGDIKNGFFHVTFPDITALVAAWQANTDAAALGDYVPGGIGICSDFERDETGDIKNGYFRVSFPDITTLVANWQMTDAQLDALGACGGEVIVPVP